MIRFLVRFLLGATRGREGKGGFMAKILIETCGYSYHEWVGPVYPAETKPGSYLACYAGLFPSVELDFAFYSMPRAGNLAKMLVDGGKGFPAPWSFAGLIGIPGGLSRA
jgi:hypothetical protein